MLYIAADGIREYAIGPGGRLTPCGSAAAVGAYGSYKDYGMAETPVLPGAPAPAPAECGAPPDRPRRARPVVPAPCGRASCHMGSAVRWPVAFRSVSRARPGVA